MIKKSPFEVVQSIIIKKLPLKLYQVTETASFIEDLGCDSLDIISVIMGIEDHLKIAIPDEAIVKIKTVGDLVNIVKTFIKENKNV